jgi:hypothetical protein
MYVARNDRFSVVSMSYGRGFESLKSRLAAPHLRAGTFNEQIRGIFRAFARFNEREVIPCDLIQQRNCLSPTAVVILARDGRRSCDLPDPYRQ